MTGGGATTGPASRSLHRQGPRQRGDRFQQEREMSDTRVFYPEFDQQEFDDVIRPLTEWDGELERSLAGRSDPALGTPVADSGPAVESAPFDAIIDGVVDEHLAGRTAPAATGEGVDADAVEAGLRLLLRERVRPVLIRPLVVAINRAREEGVLRGGTRLARYQDFCARWESEFAAVTHRSLPLLASQVDGVIRQSLAAHDLLLARFRRDRALVETLIEPTSGSPVLTGISVSGDTHARGSAVGILRFDGGGAVAYKPRSVDGEAGYAALAEELGALSGRRFEAARVVRCDGYGWVQFVRAVPPAEAPSDSVFRSGQLGALLFALNARDMHHENVLLSTSGPVPVDLETLLHPRRQEQSTTGTPLPVRSSGGRRTAQDVLSESVYGVGLLPMLITRPGDDAGHLDVGFLGRGGDGPSPYRTLRVREGFSDEMTVALESAEPDDGPAVLAAGVDPGAGVRTVASEFTAGFLDLYDWIAEHRDAFAELVVRHLGSARLRYVHNPTILYAQTLRMTSGVEVLASREVFLAVLKRIGIASKNVATTLVASEMLQLSRRDIPYFVTRVDREELTADGAIVARLEESPLESFRAKLARFGPADRSLQASLIGAAFTAQFPDNHLPESGGADGAGARRMRDDRPSSARSDLAALAVDIGDHLVDTVLGDRWAHLPPTWIGPLASASAARPWPPGVLGYDLYTGRTGPALALAALGASVGARRHLDIARQVFDASAEVLSEGRYEARSIRAIGTGAYTGLPGFLWGLAEAGRRLDRADWIEAAVSARGLVLDQLAEETDPASWDIVSGRLGALGMLRAVDPAPDAALDALVEDAVRSLAVLSGATPLLRQSGYAHGVAGAIATVARHAGPSGTRTAVLRRLLGVLDSFYDTAERDWHTDSARSGSATGWCHGSAGIALALTTCAQYAPDAGVDPDVLAASEDALIRRGFGRNTTLCHGDLGNLEVLRALDEASGGAHAQDRARVESFLSASVLRARIDEPSSRYAHTNSVMVGTSGVLLSTVRRLDPDAPSSPVVLS
ncbi:hypothetical protein C5C52_03095 [Rathayibacter sp. AY1E5]|nr:hypothetical protein C5C52_03095 [Rathayibacter sp. AY1E5]